MDIISSNKSKLASVIFHGDIKSTGSLRRKEADSCFLQKSIGEYSYGLICKYIIIYLFS